MKAHIDGKDVELTGEDAERHRESLAQTAPPPGKMPHEIASFWDRFTADEQVAFLEALVDLEVIQASRVDAIIDGEFPPPIDAA